MKETFRYQPLSSGLLSEASIDLLKYSEFKQLCNSVAITQEVAEGNSQNFNSLLDCGWNCNSVGEEKVGRGLAECEGCIAYLRKYANYARIIYSWRSRTHAFKYIKTCGSVFASKNLLSLWKSWKHLTLSDEGVLVRRLSVYWTSVSWRLYFFLDLLDFVLILYNCCAC